MKQFSASAVRGNLGSLRVWSNGDIVVQVVFDASQKADVFQMYEQHEPVAIARLTSGDAGGETPPVAPERPSASPPSVRWAQKKPSQQAYIRCTQRDFQDYAGVQSEAEAVAWLYLRCGIESRSELDTNEEAQEIWQQIEDEFTAERDYGEFL